MLYFKSSSGFSILLRCVLALGIEQLLLSLLHEDYNQKLSLEFEKLIYCLLGTLSLP